MKFIHAAILFAVASTTLVLDSIGANAMAEEKVAAATTLYPIPSSCSGAPNPFPAYTEPPVLVRTVKNAKLYTAGTGNDTFTVLHLWGTPYEKGYAQGQILAKEVLNITYELTDYLTQEIVNYVPFLPADIVALIVEYGVKPLLLMNYDWTLPFMKEEYIDEMKGIADGSGVAVEQIRMYNMFPELIKAACTIVGANKASTPNKLINQLRALDFGTDIPIKNQAQVTVYHSNDNEQTATFMTVGWTAMVGALTGFSVNGVGIGEKVWLSAPEGVDSYEGEPWMFVLRNVLEQTTTISQSLKLIDDSKRTCSIHVGVGSTADNEFRGLEIAAKAFNVYNDSMQWLPGHPAIPGVFYWNKHKQPSHSTCLADLLQQYYGSITAENLALNISPIGETGDFHSVTFDYGAKVAYVANARKTYVTSGADVAYMRQYTRLDMGALFAERSP